MERGDLLGSLTPLVRLEYRHDFDSSYNQAVQFANGVGNGAFGVGNAAAVSDAFTVGLGLDVAMANGLGLSFEYDLSGSAASRMQSLRLMARRAF